MSEIGNFVTNYGSIITSAATLFYLLSIKVNSIAAIEKAVDHIDKKVENICEIQLDHEGRISKIEGKINGSVNARH